MHDTSTCYTLHNITLATPHSLYLYYPIHTPRSCIPIRPITYPVNQTQILLPLFAFLALPSQSSIRHNQRMQRYNTTHYTNVLHSARSRIHGNLFATRLGRSSTLGTVRHSYRPSTLQLLYSNSPPLKIGRGTVSVSIPLYYTLFSTVPLLAVLCIW